MFACKHGCTQHRILEENFNHVLIAINRSKKKESRGGVIFMGYSILQEILQDAVRFFESCTAKLKKVSSKSVKYEF